jgi:methylase of polypeptide subunit release factors
VLRSSNRKSFDSLCIFIISLIKNLPTSRGTSIDINENALHVAEHNAELNDVKERIKFLHKDILTDLVNFEDKFDIVVSNPPYIPIEEYPTLQKELVEYDSVGAMTLIATIDELLGKTLTAKDIINITTVHSLMELIGMENFE